MTLPGAPAAASPLAPFTTPPGKRVAMVIGSGSVKCAAAIGAYRLLAREGIGIDMLVGCSAGSIFATVVALGYAPEACAEMASRLWTSDLTKRPNRRALLSVLFPRLFGFDESRFGFRDAAPVSRALHGAFGERSFADAPTRLFITATDFHTGEQVVLSEGTLADAIRASIAIPFAFAPVRVGERLLVDGFLSDPLPVGVAMREGADVIVAVGFDSPMQTQVSSAARFAFQLSSIMTNNLLRASFAFHGLAHHSEVIAVIPQFEQRVRLFDTAKIPYIMDEGERAMEQQMPYLRRLLAARPATA